MSVTITPVGYTAGAGQIPRTGWRVAVGIGENNLDYDTGIIPWSVVTLPTVLPGRYVDIWVYTTGNIMVEHNNYLIIDGHNYQYDENVDAGNPELMDMGVGGAVTPNYWMWALGAGAVGIALLIFFGAKK
jgi:hypothetical protein